MARPKGTKYIATPELMIELFNQYRVWVKENPFKIKDWVGGLGKEVIREKERPLTLEGFENYCYDKGVIKSIGHYFSILNNQ